MQMHESQSSQPPASPQAVNAVSINNFAFNPQSVTVKKGTTVTWTNQDSSAHTVTANNGSSGPNSDELSNVQTYSFTFNETGTFTYHCTLHPEMTGTVTVTD
jgi:plastocyanin